jgi:alpha-mannosidase
MTMAIRQRRWYRSTAAAGRAFSSDQACDAASAARFGSELSNPLEAAEIKTTDKLAGQPDPLPAGAGSMAALAPDTLAISALKGAEDGDGLVIRVAETAGKETDGTLTLPWAAVGSARGANSVEAAREPLAHDAHTVHFHVKPFAVVTLRVGAAGR